MRQGILHIPYFSIQLKTADNKGSNLLELILNPCDITFPPNNRMTIQTQHELYSEYNVTGLLQLSDILHEEGDGASCQGIITLKEGNTKVRINKFTGQLFRLKKGLHIAKFAALTPEQLKKVQTVDPVTTWHARE